MANVLHISTETALHAAVTLGQLIPIDEHGRFSKDQEWADHVISFNEFEIELSRFGYRWRWDRKAFSRPT